MTPSEQSTRMFSFIFSLSGKGRRASVTCLRCGALVAEGSPRDVYPKAEGHDCAESRP